VCECNLCQSAASMKVVDEAPRHLAEDLEWNLDHSAAVKSAWEAGVITQMRAEENKCKTCATYCSRSDATSRCALSDGHLGASACLRLYAPSGACSALPQTALWQQCNCHVANYKPTSLPRQAMSTNCIGPPRSSASQTAVWSLYSLPALLFHVSCR
jgi:hypothetical protein